jgi:hypothetical protein
MVDNERCHSDQGRVFDINECESATKIQIPKLLLDILLEPDHARVLSLIGLRGRKLVHVVLHIGPRT